MKKKTVSIVVSSYNHFITSKLLDGCLNKLSEKNIHVLPPFYVPGAFEIPYMVQKVIKDHSVDGVIALGCVIKGETPHFDFICDAVAKGMMDLTLKYHLPVIFGVLTPLTVEQALQRAGGEKGHKGEEAAQALLDLFSH